MYSPGTLSELSELLSFPKYKCAHTVLDPTTPQVQPFLGDVLPSQAKTHLGRVGEMGWLLKGYFCWYDLMQQPLDAFPVISWVRNWLDVVFSVQIQWVFNCHWKGCILSLPCWLNWFKEAMSPRSCCHIFAEGFTSDKNLVVHPGIWWSESPLDIPSPGWCPLAFQNNEHF